MTTPFLRLHRLDAHLSLAELCSAVLDGELVSMGASFRCIDEPEAPRDRAGSLAAIVGDTRVIVCDRSAAWVWGWAQPAVSLHTCVSIASRVASPVRRRLRAREAVIERDEVVQLQGVRVTTPLRTAIDLVRHDADDQVIDIIVQALRSGDVAPTALLEQLRRRAGIAHQRRARDRIDRAISRC